MSPFERNKEELTNAISSMIEYELSREEALYEATGKWLSSCSSEVPRLQEALLQAKEALSTSELYDVEY